VEIFDILGPHSHSPAPTEAKICTAKRTHVPVGHAKFDVNRCNESPLLGEKPDFWPVSEFYTGSLPLRGILPAKSAQRDANTARALAAVRFRYCPPARRLPATDRTDYNTLRR